MRSALTNPHDVAGVFETRLRGLAPEVAEDRIAELAAVWGEQHALIIERTLAITAESGRVTLPWAARPEAIGKMARLSLFLAETMIGRLTADRSVGEIDPATEREALGSAYSLERNENTAQNLASGVWFRVYDDLHRRYGRLHASVAEQDWPPQLPGRIGRRRTRRNHYIPEFTTKPWAGADGKVRVVRRDARQIVSSRLASPSGFGYEELLYPQQLEDWFALIENASARPYQHLMSVDVLTDVQRYYWMTFLITQFIRTPRFIAALGVGLSKRAKYEKWPWSMTPELARRAYQTLFQNDKVFEAYARFLGTRRWVVYRAPKETLFPRTDAPVLFHSARAGTCYYPLSPTLCFAAGPLRAEESDVPAALPCKLDREEAQGLVDSFLRHSRSAFAVPSSVDREPWIARASRLLPVAGSADDHVAWGRIR